MAGFPASDDFPGWVALFDDPARAPRAFWHIVLSGPAALGSVRAGLASPSASVRRGCTRVMDHLVDAASFPLLVDMLGDTDPLVRREGLHALACDRCKDNTCRPDAAIVLPRAIHLLLHDPDRHVRAYAVALVGRWVHTHADAADALVRARDHDAEPSVRKTAGWYAPGGTIHRRSAPRAPRPATRQR